MPRILPGKLGEGEERRAKKAGQARAGEAESIAPLPHSSPQCIIPANVPPINRPWMRPTRIYVDSIAKAGGRGFVHRSSARIDSGEGRKSVEKEVERDSEPTLPLHSSRSWEKTSDGIEEHRLGIPIPREANEASWLARSSPPLINR